MSERRRRIVVSLVWSLLGGAVVGSLPILWCISQIQEYPNQGLIDGLLIMIPLGVVLFMITAGILLVLLFLFYVKWKRRP